MGEGIFCLLATGVLWGWLGMIISNASRKELNLSCIQGGAALVAVGLCAGLLMGRGGAAQDIGALAKISFGVSGVLNYATFLLMGRAMRNGPNDIVWSMVQSALIFPFGMGIIFFGVGCTAPRLAGLVMILGALAVSPRAGRSAAVGGGTSGERGWLGWALAAFAAAGMSQCAANLPSYFSASVENGDAILKTFWFQCGTLGAFAVQFGMRRKALKWSGTGPSMGFAALAMLAAQLFFFYRGLDLLAVHGVGALAYPLALGSCIAIFFLYGILKLHERFNVMKGVMLALCLGGIMVLAIFQ